MAKKAPVLPLQRVFAALDKKDYKFYSRLTEDEKKDFANGFIHMRFNSSPEGTIDLQEYCLLSTNTYLNINFWSLSKHPELIWLMLCAANPGVGSYRREYVGISMGKKKSSAEKFLTDLYPSWKIEDVEYYASINSKAELKKLAKEHGYSDKEINSIFK
jgi:hypothetical protein